MSAAKPDLFDVLGPGRGGERPDLDAAELENLAARRRLLLATVSAHGILGHNSAASFDAERIAWLLAGADPKLAFSQWPPVTDELAADLDALCAAGLLSLWEECYYKVTPAGLIALWTGSDLG